MNKNCIVIKTGRTKSKKVLIDEILYFKADDSYSKINLINGKEITVKTLLKEFEQRLIGNHFIRISRSYLVNMNYCMEFKSGAKPELTLTNGDKLIPSASKLKQIEKIFHVHFF